MTREALETRTDLDDSRHFFIVAHCLGKRRRVLRRGGQTAFRAAGNRLRHFVDQTVRQTENAADVAHHRARGHRAEGDDLRDVLLPVLATDVVDHFPSAIHAEVDVDVRHGDALRIEEALEEKVVVERIDVGDLHRPGNERTG